MSDQLSVEQQRAVLLFFEELASLLSEAPPEVVFGDLFDDTGAPPPEERVVQASPDEIEAAVVMALQRAEIEAREIAEAKRVEAQWDIVNGLLERLDNPPPGPDDKALDILDRSKLPDVSGLANTAAGLVQTLSGLRGEPDSVFEPATASAIDALDARDAAIKTVRDAYDAGLASRRKQIDEINANMAKETAPVTGRLEQELSSEKPTKTFTALNRGLTQARELVRALPELVETALPTEFANACASATGQIEKLPDLVKKAMTALQGKIREQRSKRLADLPREPPQPITAKTVLAGQPAFQECEVRRLAYRDARKAIPSNFGTLSEEDFERLCADAEEKLELLRDAIETFDRAALQEGTRRNQIAKECRTGTVERPKALLDGTDEYKAFKEAADKFRDSLVELDKRSDTLALQDFEAAVLRVDSALAVWRKVAGDAEQQANERAKRTKDRKNEALNLVNTTVPPVQSALNRFAALLDAYNKKGRLINARFKALRGINDNDDVAIVEEIRVFCNASGLLKDEVTKLVIAPEVVSHIDVGVVITNVASSIECGALETAAGEVYKISNKATNIADRYAELDDLQGRVTTVLDILKRQPDVKSMVKRDAVKAVGDFDDAQRNRRTTTQGDLTIFIRTVREAVESITMAETEWLDRGDIRNRPTYDLSDCKTFVDNWTGAGIGNVGDLEVLIASGKAKRARGLTAMRTNYDTYPEFSVEAYIRIDGWAKLLLHAHCDIDGTPKPGHGCHIKLEADRYVTGVSQTLSNSLRNDLLPTQEQCLKAKRTAGL